MLNHGEGLATGIPDPEANVLERLGARPPQIEALWQRIHERVFMQAILRVPWKDDEDAWHAPSTAVWQAAWNAALVGISGSLGIDLDKGSLGGEWTYFRLGVRDPKWMPHGNAYPADSGSSICRRA